MVWEVLPHADGAVLRLIEGAPGLCTQVDLEAMPQSSPQDLFDSTGELLCTSLNELIVYCPEMQTCCRSMALASCKQYHHQQTAIGVRTAIISLRTCQCWGRYTKRSATGPVPLLVGGKDQSAV
jgi:hypothetical protein